MKLCFYSEEKAYRPGPNGRLTGGPSPSGWLELSDGPFPRFPELFRRDLIRECALRRYEGVLILPGAEELAELPAGSGLRVLTPRPALCTDGRFGVYLSGPEPLIFLPPRIFTLPCAEPLGAPAILTEAEKKRLLPRFSEELMVNYSVLERRGELFLVLWEGERSVSLKLREAARHGTELAFAPAALKAALQAR